MKKNIFFIPFVSIILTGCIFGVPSRAKKGFKYCFTGEKTGLDTLINVKGYYTPAPDTVIREGKKVLSNSKLGPDYIFYDNGFVEGNARTGYYIEHEELSFFAKRGGSFGRYILCDDTIKLQYISGPGGQSRELAETWFKIIDKNTLQRISFEEIYPSTSFAARYTFRPLEIKVNPEDTWIYNKRWFRCKKK
jgi:hypothetical protein